MKRLVPLLVALVLAVAAACSSGGGGDAARGDTSSSTRSSSSSTAPSTTASTAATTSSTVALPVLPETPSASEARALVTATGITVPVLEALAGGGWRVRTPCGEDAVVAGGTPLHGATVVLDPGHGGVETGAVGDNGLAEKTLNFEVAQHAKRALENAGASVVMTRRGDYRVTLTTRAEIATRLQTQVFVSVHYNGGPDGPSDKPGTETYFQIGKPESRRLAGILYEEVLADLQRYPGVRWTADRDAGAKYRPNSSGGDYYGILRHSASVTAVLSEGAFLSNPPEAEVLARPEVQRSQGEAIARGIIRFLTTDDPGSGYVEPYPRTEPAGPGGGARGCEDPALT